MTRIPATRLSVTVSVFLRRSIFQIKRLLLGCFWGELECAEWFPGARFAANKAYASLETSGALDQMWIVAAWRFWPHLVWGGAYHTPHART